MDAPLGDDSEHIFVILEAYLFSNILQWLGLNRGDGQTDRFPRIVVLIEMWIITV